MVLLDDGRSLWEWGAIVCLLGVFLAGCAPNESTSNVQKYVEEPKMTEPMMDVYAANPKHDLHRGIILIHGGGWVSGDKAEMGPIAKDLAEAGFTCFSINYGLAPAHIWPTQLDDCQHAVTFIKAHAKEYGIDSKKIGAAGVSAGGHLSMLLGVTGEPATRVLAVGSISGIHDLNAPLTKEGDDYKIVERLMGEAGAPDVEKRRQASPVTYVNPQSAPVYFIQGKSDPLVPQSQTDLAAKALATAKVETRVLLVEGMGHGLDLTHPSEKTALSELAEWLKGRLK